MDFYNNLALNYAKEIKSALRGIAFLLMVFIIYSVLKQEQETKYSQYFFDNQKKFEQLSELTCSLFDSDFSRLEYQVGEYYNREPFFSIPSTYPDDEYEFKWQRLNEYASGVEKTLLQIDRLLVDLDLEDLTATEIAGECRIFNYLWGWGMNGEGQFMNYVLNPQTVYPYDPSIHRESHRDRSTQIDFSIALSAGWYLTYSNTP